MKRLFLIILFFNLSYAEYLDIQYASFSYTIGGSYGSCVKFKKSEYNFNDFDACSCAWAANTSNYSDCYELYYNPQTKIIKYNLSEGASYIYRNFSSDYTCHIYNQEIQMNECSEMNETVCNNNDNCEWVEDFQTENCYGIAWNEQDCEEVDGCNWWISNYYGTSNCTGSYQVDNSYCEEVSYIPGDTNGDGNLNVSDIVLIVDLILYSQYDEYSDINQDGILNIIDIVELVNLILSN